MFPSHMVVFLYFMACQAVKIHGFACKATINKNVGFNMIDGRCMIQEFHKSIHGSRMGLRMSNSQTDEMTVTGKANSTTKKSRGEIRAEDIANRDLADFGSVLRPIAETLDNATDGWALSYADLHPENENTAAGRVFLGTNALYALVGIILASRGDLLLGGLTEVAGIVSYWYHYSQLKFGQNSADVRLALLTDYFAAGITLITGGIYIAQVGLVDAIPLDVILSGALALVCLTMGWVW